MRIWKMVGLFVLRRNIDIFLEMRRTGGSTWV
jgi:hypothetical protein